MPNWNLFKKSPSASERKEKAYRASDSTHGDVESGQFPIAIPKWALGILNDRQTDEVPGSVVLLAKASKRNEPLGLHHTRARTSSSSLPSPYPASLQRLSKDQKKKTRDGRIVLEPQPDDSHNDPLNWPSWRRNAALLSLGFYCMLGGGMTPVLAAGYNQVSAYYGVSIARVSLTTGLYMMGMGIGSVFLSPTAILFGKRPVYLISCILFILSSVWCALSPNFASLVVARVFQGFSVSPVECLPSASIAEIFFLHERAYRLGIYTLLLLGGKNLIPLVSAAIIQTLSWQWVFWIIAMVVGFGGVLLFLFVPETFWDRTPRPSHHDHLHVPKLLQTISSRSSRVDPHPASAEDPQQHMPRMNLRLPSPKKKKNQHVEFLPPSTSQSNQQTTGTEKSSVMSRGVVPGLETPPKASDGFSFDSQTHIGASVSTWQSPSNWDIVDEALPQKANTPALHNLNSPWYTTKASDDDYFALSPITESEPPTAAAQKEFTASRASTPQLTDLPSTPMPTLRLPNRRLKVSSQVPDSSTITKQIPRSVPADHVVPLSASEDKSSLGERGSTEPQSGAPTSVNFNLRDHIAGEAEPVLPSPNDDDDEDVRYTDHYRAAPTKSYVDTLQPYSGRLSHDSWFRVALRPFILYAYPAILWSVMVYSLSVGWLIVLSESVTIIYKSRDSYNFTSIQVGLVYLSPFIGGILGTAVAGKVSDLVVRFMARRNDGIYEPEFRLVMAIPTAITSVIGLMGFGWSAAERDNWFIPTFFFGVISFGCCLGSTTSITFAVDSYRQYAGEALVALNFSKNIFHGLVFSLFFTSWLEGDGSKKVFLALGCIQLGCLALTVPMYIFGKRARMWTVRMNLMEKF